MVVSFLVKESTEPQCWLNSIGCSGELKASNNLFSWGLLYSLNFGTYSDLKVENSEPIGCSLKIFLISGNDLIDHYLKKSQMLPG